MPVEGPSRADSGNEICRDSVSSGAGVRWSRMTAHHSSAGHRLLLSCGGSDLSFPPGGMFRGFPPICYNWRVENIVRALSAVVGLLLILLKGVDGIS